MLTGVALFTLSACADSVSEFFGLEDRERISFTATTDEKIEELTRAAINEDSYVTAFQNTQPKKPLVLSSSVTRRDTETTRGQRIGSAEDLTAFRVSAAIASRNVSEDAFAALTPNYFYNLKAQKNSDDIFEISRDYYWPSSDDKLWFYAYAPCDDSNVLISDQTVGGPQKISFTVATNVNNQVDLMTANAATTSFTSASGETTKTSVALNFRHELTAIRFIIGEQWLAGSIKSIGIYNVHGRGTMTIGADDATKWEWKNKAGNAVAATDDFVLTVDKGGLSGTDGEEFIEDTDLYFLMIPQSFDDNNDAYIEVKYQDNAREYTVSAPLKGQPAWVRNTTVTYAISSHELTKLKIGTISWPDATGDDAWNGPKTDFAAGDEVGLYVVDPDGLTIQPHHQNVRCSYDGGSWTVHHPEDHPVYKLSDYQYFFYYPYTPTPDTTYPVAGQNTTNTTATAFFSHLIDGWRPAAVQNTSLATLNAQDLQVAKGVDDAQQSSTVNATMAHQMNLAKLKLGGTSVTDTWIYPIDNGAYTWNYQPDNRDVMASDNFSVNFPYLYSDAHYYFVFAPVETNTDTGVLLKALNNLGTATDWSWELKSLERGKLLTHTATSADVGNNVMHNNELTVAQISPLTATGSALTIPVTVTVNSTTLTKGTDYTVSYKNSSNTTVTSISAAGNYTAYISPKGRYSGDAVPRAFTVNKAGKGISFANTNVEKTYGDAAFTQTVTNTGTGTVTYSSGNTNVATVNSSSGQVTIKAAGTAVITATVADSEYDSYATKTATYTLTVNKAASTYTAPTAKDLTYSGSAQALVNAGSTSHGTMQYKLSTSSTWSTSIPTATNAGSYTVDYKVVGDANHKDNSGGNVAVTVNRKALGNNSSTFNYSTTSVTKTYIWELNGYSNSTLTIPSGHTVTYSSSNTGVATVNSSGVLSAGTTANTTTTITATLATGNYSGTATYTIKGTYKVLNYAWTGAVQSATLPKGKWQIQCWGAQGGAIGSYRGGYGGYTAGTVSLSASTNVYIFVGGSANRFNGGLAAPGFGGGSGGGTDVRLVNGSWDNAASLRSRIIVAGGGGGACQRGEGYGDGIGGYGGGLTAGTGQHTNRYGTNASYGYNTCYGGSQTAGGAVYWNDLGLHAFAAGYWTELYGSFGKCSNSTASGHSIQGAGGGGWYGGGGGGHSGGGGGSSFISGHSGCNAVNTSTGAHLGAGTKTTYNSVTYTFTNITMIDGEGRLWPSNSSSRGSAQAMPKPGSGSYASGTGHTGNGYVTITWAGN